YSDVIVAASKYDNGELDEGAAWVYYGSASGLNMGNAVMLQGNQAGARFGCSVSTAGDVNKDGYSDIMVGALFYDKGETNEGAVFVYHGSAAGISTNASLVLEGNQAEANFGNAMGLAGDVNGDGYSDVVIGVHAYDSGQVNEGVAFVYHGSAQGLNANNPVKIEGNQAESAFGFTAAGAGDVNGDGYSDIMVGARLFDKGEVDEGAVFIYHGSALGVNSNVPAVILESNQVSAFLGNAIGTAGDVNGDGYSDIIITANMYDKGQTNEGAAFIHHGSAQGISPAAALTLEMNQAEAQFGSSAGSAGDVNGDGYADVIIGAKYYDNGHLNEGAAFVFQGAKTGISSILSSTLESNKTGAQFGCSVASAGDVNGDGYSDVIVGAIAYDNGHDDEGAVFVWKGGVNFAESIQEALTLKISKRISVSGAGDVNGDGFNDVMVGVPNYDPHGAVFIYHGSLTGVNFNSPTVIENVPNSGEFGYSVAQAGDLNGDGFGDIVVGDLTYFVKMSPQFEVISGAALVYYGSASGIKANLATILPTDKGTSLMAWSVAGAGDVNGDGYGDLVVGDESYDNGQLDEGAIFVYHGSQTGVSTTPAAIIESNGNYAQLGYSVSCAGDVNGDGYSDIVAGAPYFTNPESHEGAVFLYYGSQNGVSKNLSLKLEKNQVSSGLGVSVSSAGDINGDGYSDVIVGADYYNNGSYNEGVALVYHGSPSGLNPVAITLECNQAEANFGRNVSSAGDLNGDGYSDIVIAAPNYMIPQSVWGTSFVYYGSSSGIVQSNGPAFAINNYGERGPVEVLELFVSAAGDVDGDGFSDLLAASYLSASNSSTEKSVVLAFHGSSSPALLNNLCLYNTNLTTPINQTQFAQNNFGAGLYSKSFLGSNKGKLVWETKASGRDFRRVLIM
ncbi:integrin alpha, partial [Dyadobacter sp.]|uniref:integrin alpha n=1 Tax=Dyadobacter sp. TaxID=1914288 RepID=UPI003F726264